MEDLRGAVNGLDIQDLGDEVNEDYYIGAKITAIGVGGGGSNTINHLMEYRNTDIEGVTLIAANTDLQHLTRTKSMKKIQLGQNVTKGRGAGINPEIGEKAAEESYRDLVEILKGYDTVFIAAGLGGGTGTGASPLVAKAAQENGALTISIVTKPFQNEGMKRAKIANEGYKKLREYSDCIIVIPNEKLMANIDAKMGHRDAMKMVDNVMANAVLGLSNIILGGNEEGSINIDFADVCTAMKNKGLAVMNMGHADGEEAAERAFKMATQLDLLGHTSINGATGILVCLECHPNYPAQSVDKIRELAVKYETEDTDSKFGLYYNSDFKEDEARVTFIATGFEDNTLEDRSVTEPSLPITTRQQGDYRPSVRIVGGDVEVTEDNVDVPPIYRNQRD